MAKSCCKYFTVSLVPVASLTLAVLFALGIVVLPILYVHLADHYKVSVGAGLDLHNFIHVHIHVLISHGNTCS